MKTYSKKTCNYKFTIYHFILDTYNSMEYILIKSKAYVQISIIMKSILFPRKLVLGVALLFILIFILVWVISGIHANKPETPLAADSIKDVNATIVKDSQVTSERHWTINSSLVDVIKTELSPDAITVLFSGSDIPRIIGYSAIGSVYRTIGGKIDTISIDSSEIHITICTDCDPPKPIKNGIIPSNAIATIVGDYLVYLIEHENNDTDLFMIKERQTIWVWSSNNREIVIRLGDMILKSMIDYNGLINYLES